MADAMMLRRTIHIPDPDLDPVRRERLIAHAFLFAAFFGWFVLIWCATWAMEMEEGAPEVPRLIVNR